MSRQLRLLITVVALVPPPWLAFGYTDESVSVGGVPFAPDGRGEAQERLTLSAPPMNGDFHAEHGSTRSW
jgi:hypothetical protein